MYNLIWFDDILSVGTVCSVHETWLRFCWDIVADIAPYGLWGLMLCDAFVDSGAI